MWAQRSHKTFSLRPARSRPASERCLLVAHCTPNLSELLFSGGGGWANGDAAFVGPNPTDEAVITYYQKKRHIFGDLKIEVFDPDGKLLGTIPSSKRRGLSRATWPMRLKAPKVPRAASAAFGAAFGPRVLPGTYTVKMTKDKQVYTTQLLVGTDPRSKHTPADRKTQFDLALKLYDLLGNMTFGH